MPNAASAAANPSPPLPSFMGPCGRGGVGVLAALENECESCDIVPQNRNALRLPKEGP